MGRGLLISEIFYIERLWYFGSFEGLDLFIFWKIGLLGNSLYYFMVDCIYFFSFYV